MGIICGFPPVCLDTTEYVSNSFLMVSGNKFQRTSLPSLGL